MTGDPQWESEYRLLIEHESFLYADLASDIWRRWVWRAFNEDDNPERNRYRLDFP